MGGTALRDTSGRCGRPASARTRPWRGRGTSPSRPGAAAVRRWHASGTPFDALFAANDQSALGALEALAALGRRVPEDVAVVGFDDMPEAASARPPLTTVRQPFREMSRRGAVLLGEWLSTGRAPASDTRILLPASLIIRSSCGLSGM